MNIGKKTEDYIICDYILYTVVWCYLTKDPEQEGKIHKFQHEEVIYATDEDASIEERIDVGEDRVERRCTGVVMCWLCAWEKILEFYYLFQLKNRSNGTSKTVELRVTNTGRDQQVGICHGGVKSGQKAGKVAQSWLFADSESASGE
jgi:hypothetical protein